MERFTGMQEAAGLFSRRLRKMRSKMSSNVRTNSSPSSTPCRRQGGPLRLWVRRQQEGFGGPVRESDRPANLAGVVNLTGADRQRIRGQFGDERF